MLESSITKHYNFKILIKDEYGFLISVLPRGESRRLAKFLLESNTFHIKSKALEMLSCKSFATLLFPSLPPTEKSSIAHSQINFPMFPTAPGCRSRGTAQQYGGERIV